MLFVYKIYITWILLLYLCSFYRFYIIEFMKSNIISLEYGKSLVSCKTTIGYVINIMLFHLLLLAIN